MTTNTLRFFSTSRAYFSEHDKVHSLLKKFLIPTSSRSQASLNTKLHALQTSWNISEQQFLPLVSPLNISPFEYHSRYNSDLSYVISPRLSVTKLLTSSWCELRDYYEVYAGSLQTKKLRAVIQGSKYHNKLESQLHEKIDTDYLVEELRGAMETMTWDKPQDQVEQMIFGFSKESTLAMEWSETIISRLFQLVTTSEAREVLVHCYIDLNGGNFLHKASSLETNKKVLVSGIIDYLLLHNPEDITDISLFNDVKDALHYDFPPDENGTQLFDLTRMLQTIEPIIREHSENFKVTVTDVKTRSRKTIPSQKSVVEAAKLQTFYYTIMVSILSQSEFAYHSLIENAKSRGLDVDAPINVSTLASILRQNYQLFYKDFIKLANGESIGFAVFDDYTKAQQYPEYDLSGFTIDDHTRIKENSELDLSFEDLMTDKLLTSWKIPPTLRYFAARGSQFFSLIHNLLGGKTTVEYHTSFDGMLFHENVYELDVESLKEHLKSAATFWNGKRYPFYTDDVSRCNYCDFKEKCMVPNGTVDSKLPNKKAVGYRLNAFLHSGE